MTPNYTGGEASSQLVMSDGEFQDGIREGKGKLTWADGSCYKGPLVVPLKFMDPCLVRTRIS